jgi:hypothetical protein
MIGQEPADGDGGRPQNAGGTPRPTFGTKR